MQQISCNRCNKCHLIKNFCNIQQVPYIMLLSSAMITTLMQNQLMLFQRLHKLFVVAALGIEDVYIKKLSFEKPSSVPVLQFQWCSYTKKNCSLIKMLLIQTNFVCEHFFLKNNLHFFLLKGCVCYIFAILFSQVIQ